MFASLLTSADKEETSVSELSRPLSPDPNKIHVNDKLSTHSNENTRETWSTNCDYLITTLGGLIGLGMHIKQTLFIQFS